MKCSECGRHITPRSKFCPYCGKPVAPRRNKVKTQAARPRWPLYISLVSLGIALGIIAIHLLQKQKMSADAAVVNFDPTLRGEELARLYPAVYEVASHFICPCGTCSDGLEVCDCNMPRGAAEVRMLIYQLLQVHEPEHAIDLIAAQYGHRKNSAPDSLKIEPLLPPASWQGPPKK
ncbi:MAG: zinc ribbon domain-containing protein [candidate division KSB1 bacterium]|nr:zinc ribbon domain-containing protein [candidate division KSB1 bacterium]MDZ7304680.1 zinc ribbon domain-containing protein [candidate division KSB1 bacterium]MDZ7313788.1 zinc ribbon domain-containing protein [candidate division KSB1 bacterium]